MGNKIARTTQASATEYYLHDLPSTYNLVLLDVVSRGRFLKFVLCKHDEGLLLVKVYFKRAGEPLDLKEHERRLERIRRAFQGLEGSHVLPFQIWFQTDKAAYLLRQYFYSNLHDRLGTRPFLSQIEKKWLAFQLIHAVEQSHSVFLLNFSWKVSPSLSFHNFSLISVAIGVKLEVDMSGINF
ncbi:hypothetical protein ACQ4PT_001371 [Festuca glaucescens]